MALILKENYKGRDAEYWCIIQSRYDKFSNTTSCIINLYFDEEARRNSLNDSLKTEERSYNGTLSIAELYAKIKEPIMENKYIGEYGADGLPILIQEDTNKFSQAIDVI